MWQCHAYDLQPLRSAQPRLTTLWTFRPPKVHIEWRGVSWAERWAASQASGAAGLAEVEVGRGGRCDRCDGARETGERPGLQPALYVGEGAAGRWISETGGRPACKQQLRELVKIRTN